MDAFIKWSEGKDPFVATISHNYANLSSYCYALLILAQDDVKFASGNKMPELEIWLSLYKEHRRMQKVQVQLGQLGGYRFEEDVFSKKVGDINSSEELSEYMITEVLGEQSRESHFEFYVELNKKEPGELPKELDSLLRQPEAYFMWRVYLPCWLLFGKLPGHLLRNARLGDIDDFEKLLQLDSSVLFEPRLAEAFHQIRAKDRFAYERLSIAISSTPKKKITIQKIKVFMAGYISLMSEVFGNKLNEPDIRELFDCIRKDEGKGDIDTHLPDGADAFSKAIRREKKFWMKAISKSDKI